MGSSARKKRENAKDFKKQKLRVGKTKPKPDNFTDTSFRSKSIVIKKQSLTVSAPSNSSQFIHFLSLASTSKNDSQRRDALSYLSSQISSLPVNHELPLPTSSMLLKLLPLILDGSNSVRSQLLKFFRFLPTIDITDRTENILLYIRAGMTHLSTEVRMDALGFLDWLLEVSEEEVVSCPGGWIKMLKCFMSMMGWAVTNETDKWTSRTNASFSNNGKTYPKQLQALSKFLKVGLVESEIVLQLAAKQKSDQLKQNISVFPITDIYLNMIPTISNPYAHLNIFGQPRDEDGEAYSDRQVRQRIFHQRFLSEIKNGVERARKEGGEIGRAAGLVDEILRKGMSDYVETN